MLFWGAPGGASRGSQKLWTSLGLKVNAVNDEEKDVFAGSLHSPYTVMWLSATGLGCARRSDTGHLGLCFRRSRGNGQSLTVPPA